MSNRNHINDSTSVRLISLEGRDMGMVPMSMARHAAAETGLDAVVVSEDPPVVRIMDSGRMKYEEEKRERRARANAHAASVVKEVRFAVGADAHDVEIKTCHAIAFLRDGYKVRVTVVMRGRRRSRPEYAHALMASIVKSLTAALADDGIEVSAASAGGDNGRVVSLLTPVHR